MVQVRNTLPGDLNVFAIMRLLYTPVVIRTSELQSSVHIRMLHFTRDIHIIQS